MHKAPSTSVSDRRNPEFPLDSHPDRRAYPSDLSNRQWDCISPLISKESTIGRPRLHPLREIVDAINYRWQTGCVWRMLPHDFPPWETVYSHFRDWQRRGLLRQIRETMLRPDRETETPKQPPRVQQNLQQDIHDNRDW